MWSCQNFGFGFGWILSLLIWVVIIWVIIVLLRMFWHHSRYGKSDASKHWMMGHSNAMEILRERYAKGEITKEDFEKMKKDLME